MDCGTQIMQTVLVFCINLPDLTFPTWWGKLSAAWNQSEGILTLTFLLSVQATIRTSPIGASHRTANYQRYVYCWSQPHVSTIWLIVVRPRRSGHADHPFSVMNDADVKQNARPVSRYVGGDHAFHQPTRFGPWRSYSGTRFR